ncbi:zinc ribbon domain-containing protein [Micromonospora sp. NPDC049523]|uniref:zinc ribbon domain-containing protein n=1 Tax=Micromonospora sp. NPDC049523 TaxID=3155921 RepID=UPI0034349ECE
MRCPSCGQDNDPSQRYCARCNTSLHDTETPTTEPVRSTLPPATTVLAYSPTGTDEESYEPRRRMARTFGGWPLVIIAVAVVAAAGILMTRQTRQTAEQQPQPPLVEAPQDSPPGPPTTTGVIATTAPATGDAPTSSPTAGRAQAVVLDQLLADSVASRRKLVQANEWVSGCTNLARAVTALRQVGDERRGQLARVAALPLDALASGEDLRHALRVALQHSLNADEHYVEWAAGMESSRCRGSARLTAARKDGEAESDAAGAAKTEVVELWNPVADEFGLPRRTRDDI